jgi:hypothetical protein
MPQALMFFDRSNACASAANFQLCNFPESDLNEAARAADATRDVVERWLLDGLV